MDKLVGNTVKKVMGEGEKKAPVKSIKLKIKFQKEKMADSMVCKKCGKKHGDNEHE